MYHTSSEAGESKNTKTLSSAFSPRVVFSLKGTIINFDFESTLADFQLLLQGHDHQRGQACRCFSLRLLQHRRQVGNNSQWYLQYTRCPKKKKHGDLVLIAASAALL